MSHGVTEASVIVSFRFVTTGKAGLSIKTVGGADLEEARMKWLGQTMKACISTLSLGGSGGLGVSPPGNFFKFDALRSLLRPQVYFWISPLKVPQPNATIVALKNIVRLSQLYSWLYQVQSVLEYGTYILISVSVANMNHTCPKSHLQCPVVDPGGRGVMGGPCPPLGLSKC